MVWPCSRLVLEGFATITEVTTLMSIDEVLDWNESADALADVQNAPAAPVELVDVSAPPQGDEFGDFDPQAQGDYARATELERDALVARSAGESMRFVQ